MIFLFCIFLILHLFWVFFLLTSVCTMEFNMFKISLAASLFGSILTKNTRGKLQTRQIRAIVKSIKIYRFDKTKTKKFKMFFTRLFDKYVLSVRLTWNHWRGKSVSKGMVSLYWYQFHFALLKLTNTYII